MKDMTDRELIEVLLRDYKSMYERIKDRKDPDIIYDILHKNKMHHGLCRYAADTYDLDIRERGFVRSNCILSSYWFATPFDIIYPGSAIMVSILKTVLVRIEILEKELKLITDKS